MLTKPIIDKYLKANLFEELGVLNMTPEERASFVDAFGNVLQMRLTYRLMRELPEEAKGKLDEVLTKNPNDDVAIVQVLNAALPNFQQIAEEEVAQYKKELVQRMKV